MQYFGGKNLENKIALNFLEITPKEFNITFYSKNINLMSLEEQKKYYKANLKLNSDDIFFNKYAIIFDKCEDFTINTFPHKWNLNLTKRYLLQMLEIMLCKQSIELYENHRDKYTRIYLPIKKHNEGTETIWLEPYYLPCQDTFGLLIDYRFFVDNEYKKQIKGSVDKQILKLSGSLDFSGNSNRDYYSFKFKKIEAFLNKYYSTISYISTEETNFKIAKYFTELKSDSLKHKIYQMSEGKESNSTYLGLQNFGPLQIPLIDIKYIFVFKENDRNVAINLLKGLQGITYPSTFRGIESIFRIPFDNSKIQGKKVEELNDQVFEDVIQDIINERNQNCTMIPIFITNSKTSDDDDKLYYRIKYLFTRQGIPCQIVTKALINTAPLKYSLCNIGLQIFAKVGGKPWKVKADNDDGLIIGIGDKHKKKVFINEFGISQQKIEKYLTYSVLTDSSGIFKEIQILSDTDNEDDYYSSLVEKLKKIILQATNDGYKSIVIHVPFKISKSKVWDVIFRDIPADIIITVLIINSNHKYFGFDFSKNSYVPYESTYVALSINEYLVWFEGLQYTKTSIPKLIGAPVYINLWYSNKSHLVNDTSYRKKCLQDCINLSGANWRGFRAKQLPVSIFYCNTIAEFLKKFEDYKLSDIKIENLKPWFL